MTREDNDDVDDVGNHFSESEAAGPLALHLLEDARERHGISCERKRSHIARRALQKTLWRAADRARTTLPPSCPLRPDADVYFPFVDASSPEHLEHLRDGFPQCAFCGRRFRHPNQLERHMNRRHADHLLAHNGTCFADFCDVLQCQLLEGSSSGECDDSALARARSRCEYEIVQACFRSNESRVASAVRLHLCDKLTCDSRWQLQQLVTAETGGYSISTYRAGFALTASLIALVALLVSCALLPMQSNPGVARSATRQALSNLPGGQIVYEELKRRNIVRRAKVA